MKYELKLHRITFGILTALLVAFVALLLRIRPSLADERLEVIASLTIVVITAAAFVTIGMIEGTMAFQFGRMHKRELVTYLLLGLLSLASGIYLAVSEQASLQTIALVAVPHALLFGLAEIRMAQHLERHPAYRKGLFLCGLIEVALGFALIAGSRLSNEGTGTLLGYVAILSILQLLPLLFYSARLGHRQPSMD
jgi:hypothetical protein